MLANHTAHGGTTVFFNRFGPASDPYLRPICTPRTHPTKTDTPEASCPAPAHLNQPSRGLGPRWRRFAPKSRRCAAAGR